MADTIATAAIAAGAAIAGHLITAFKDEILALFRPGSKQSIRGNWQGAAEPLTGRNAPKVSLHGPFDIRLQLKQALRKVSGHMYFGFSGREYEAEMKGRMVIEGHYTFEYTIKEEDKLHYGIASLLLNRAGDTLRGYYITSPSMVGDLHVENIHFLKKL